MRFDARHIGSGVWGVWGVWDGGVMSWRGTDFGENEAKQRAADLIVMYGDRDQKERREVQPPIAGEAATWSAAGELDYWVKERFEWWGRVRGPDGQPVWIRAADLLESGDPTVNNLRQF